MATAPAPYWPIVYVRGYAMTPAEIADAVSSPYMGFNVGQPSCARPGTARCGGMCSSRPWCA